MTGIKKNAILYNNTDGVTKTTKEQCMTEDDTFNRLRRPTFAELRELFRALDRKDGYTDFLKSRNKLLKENNWTVDEYHSEYFKT